MKSADIRRTFLDFFEQKGHQIVASSALVPESDPTLLFTNAGMVQFKNVFLGQETRPYVRATSSQCCLRAGGKHNDLENVGYTARHHTFFEMLGNFSFGDYFKKEAIQYAWELLIDVFKLDPSRLWVTVYETDDEAYNIWKNDIGIATDRLIRIGDKPGGGSDNFWQMADIGPCGPCTEIFYDHGPALAGGPPGNPDEDGDRYVEIWNLVFMQYNRDTEGNLHPLPKPSVDTGMGLERMAAVLQGVVSNYDIDLFQGLIRAAADVTDTEDLSDNSLKVLADHIRATAFVIADGVLPSADGRGYVLRRIIRRAIRHGYQLGQKQPFFYQLVKPLIQWMGDAYPMLQAKEAFITQTILAEEEKFAETLDNGMSLLKQAIEAASITKQIDGGTAFKLYDTYGFPLDLTADMAREAGFTIDQAGFDEAMAQQRARAKAASRFVMQENITYDGQKNAFHGYECLTLDDAKVEAIYVNQQPVTELEAGTEALIVLDKTPFYAESGGQVGDEGSLSTADGEFVVHDTQKIQPDVFGHIGQLNAGTLKVGQTLTATVASMTRLATIRNHSATHLLHAALRKVLGNHVAQRGSLVAPDRLRFDFSHPNPMTAEEMAAVEMLVNRNILDNLAVEAAYSSYNEAIESGVTALFGEKYGDTVRTIRMGEFSAELCGGTHVNRTGDIGLFRILSESGISAGVRRIEAATGLNAIAVIDQQRTLLNDAAGLLKTQPSDVLNKIETLMEANREADKALAAVKAQAALGHLDQMIARATQKDGMTLIVERVDGLDTKTMREMIDQLKGQLNKCIILLASVNEDKITLLAGVTNNLTDKFKAGELISLVAGLIGGKGGGRPDMAQGGGTQIAALPEALETAKDWLARQS